MSDNLLQLFWGIKRSDTQVEVFAPAKLNLLLKVLNRRNDGYHNIESLMVMLAWGDRLVVEFEPAPQTHIVTQVAGNNSTITAQGLRKELTTRAANFFLKRANLSGKVRITVTKQIPIRSGLGGGSSDAAAVLRALQLLTQIQLRTLASPLEIATTIGADVPFFLSEGHKWVSGIGEKTQPIKIDLTGEFLLVLPEFGFDTAQMYSSLGRGTNQESNPSQHSAPEYLTDDSGGRIYKQRIFDKSSLCGMAENDFFDVAVSLKPELAVWLEELRRQGARFYGMTGSGAALFGYFEDKSASKRAASVLSRVIGIKGVLNVNLLHW